MDGVDTLVMTLVAHLHLIYTWRRFHRENLHVGASVLTACLIECLGVCCLGLFRHVLLGSNDSPNPGKSGLRKHADY